MRKDVSKCCHACEWYDHIRGVNPQTGEQIDKWGCAIAFMPMLMIENSQQQRQTGAAVESFRNEVARQQAATFAGPRVVAVQPLPRNGPIHAIEDQSDQ